MNTKSSEVRTEAHTFSPANFPMKTALIDLHYLPCTVFFAALIRFDVVKIEAQETFQKQTYRNRCYINTAQGSQRLSVPLLKANRHHPIQAVQIDYTNNWHVRHQRSLQAAYAKTPFFDFYASEFWQILLSCPTHLFTLNKKLLLLCLSCLGISCKIEETEVYRSTPLPATADLRGKINPKKNNALAHFKPYIQVFGDKFSENLSILDLLFCEGPNAKQILKETKINWENWQ